MLKLSPKLLTATLLVAAAAATALPAHAQYKMQEIGSLDKPIEPYKAGEVGVAEKLGSVVSASTKFVDEKGNHVLLGDYLNKDRPIILWMGYYECPMLCDKMSAGMVDAVKAIKLDAGKEFAIVNVSIDPNESAGLANAKKTTYLKELGQPGNAAAWNLLTGSPESVKELADSVGFKFKKVEIKGEVQYAHPAVLMVLSPEGKVTRYLYPVAGPNVAFDPTTMRLSLIEASEGRIGTVVDRLFLTCLHYDSRTGVYTKDAVAMMKWAGAFTILCMGGVLVPLWVKAARRRPSDDDGVPPGTRSMPA